MDNVCIEKEKTKEDTDHVLVQRRGGVFHGVGD